MGNLIGKAGESAGVQKYANVVYEALAADGPCLREAQAIRELPWALRMIALEEATAGIAKVLGLVPARRISFGAPVFEAFGMGRPEAVAHECAEVLLMAGGDVPLVYCALEALH